jgi:hypothetical protein
MPKSSSTKKLPAKLHSFSFSSSILIDSCPIPKTNIHIANRESYTLSVEAEESMPISEYLKKITNGKHMEYRHAEKMIQCIGKQLQKMESLDHGIPSFNLDDITVFFIRKPPSSTDHSSSKGDSDDDDDGDDDGDTANPHSNEEDIDNQSLLYDTKYDIYFAITNDDNICEFLETSTKATATAAEYQQLNITTPLSIQTTTSYHKNKSFISPEFEQFQKTKTLPYHIHFKSGYYSFGLLCIYCILTRKNLPYTKESLQPILDTKIYWFLIRVLNENPSERRYICV